MQFYSLFIYLFTLASDLWVWFVIILLRFCPAKVNGKLTTTGQRLHFIHGGFWVEIRPKTFVYNLMQKLSLSGGCLGNGGWLKNAKKLDVIDTKTEYHEGKHQKQYQVMCVLFSILSLYAFLCGASWHVFLLCIIAWPLSYLISGIVSILRGEKFYRDNVFEESAFSQSKLFTPGDIVLNYMNKKRGEK